MQRNEGERLSELELDDLLREWHVAEAPERLRGRLFPQRRRAGMWLLPLAASIVLAAIAGGFLRHGDVTPKRQAAFEPIPYTVPLGEDEAATVVRMEIPVAELMAAGFRVGAADPSAVVAADVLVGADGRPHAIRLVSTAIARD